LDELTSWLNAIECVLAPCAIALVMYALFEAWDRRRRRSGEEYGLPPIDYRI